MGDPVRVRLLRLLVREELSVAELQEILGMAQSRISMQLAQLKRGNLVDVRRAGSKSLYRYRPPAAHSKLLGDVLRESAGEIADAERDDRALDLILRRRKDKLRGYFDELAGRFGRDYVPGRNWRALSEMLLRLLPPMVIADLGAGEATLSLMLAQRAKRVIAVDHSRKMIEYGRAIAKENGVSNFDYRLGDLEDLPLHDNETDLVLLHQSLHHAAHPETALREAWRVLKPGGRVAIMDLVKHGKDEARELYGDLILGFSQGELLQLLQTANFVQPSVAVVHREKEAPNFQTVLAIAEKPPLKPPALSRSASSRRTRKT